MRDVRLIDFTFQSTFSSLHIPFSIDLQVGQVAQADLLLVVVVVVVVIFEFSMLDGKDPEEPGRIFITINYFVIPSLLVQPLYAIILFVR